MNTIKQGASLLFLAVGLACLSACSSLSLKTAWTLKSLDYMSLDPGIVRLALALPEGAKFTRLHMTQQFKYKTDEAMLVDDNIDLEVTALAEGYDRAGLPSTANNLYIVRVPQSRVNDVLNFQSLLNAERVAGKGASASFGIDSKLDPEWIEHYCENKGGPLYLSAWILVDELQGYLPLIKDSHLGKLLDQQTEALCVKVP